MSKKKIILSTLLLFAIISPCFLLVSLINTSVEIDGELTNTNITTLPTPKSSGYAVTKLWNDTTVGSVTCVAVSADGNYMAVATEDNLLTDETLFFYITSNHDGIPMWSYKAPTNWSSHAISEDGSYIVAGTQVDQVAVLLNSSLPGPGQDKKVVWMVNWGDAVNSVDISADGDLIVVGGDNPGISDGRFRLYNNSSGNLFDDYLWTCSPVNHVLSVAISYDGKYVVAGTDYAGSGLGTIIFLNTTDYTGGEPMFYDNAQCNITSVAISKNGEYYVAGTVMRNPGHEVLLFSRSAKGALEWSHDFGVTHAVNSIAISADGEYIATGCDVLGNGGETYLFNKSGIIGKEMWSYASNGDVNSVDITEYGNYIVAGTGYSQSTGDIDENTIFLFNKSADGVKQPEWYFNTSDNVNSVSISDDGRYIGAGGMSTSGEAYLFYHAIPIPPALTSGGDDDDDDEAGAIPYGNYYLLFVLFGIVALIIIYNRKTTLSKK